MTFQWYYPAPDTSRVDKTFAVCLTLVLLACLWVAFVVGQDRQCNRLVQDGAPETTIARYCGPDHFGSRSWS